MEISDGLVQLTSLIGAAVASLAGAVSIAFTVRRGRADRARIADQTPVYRRPAKLHKPRSAPFPVSQAPVLALSALVIVYRGEHGTLVVPIRPQHEDSLESWVADIAADGFDADVTLATGTLALGEDDVRAGPKTLFTVALTERTDGDVYKELLSYKQWTEGLLANFEQANPLPYPDDKDDEDSADDIDEFDL